MTLPTVTQAQLEPLLERLFRRAANGDAGHPQLSPVVLVRADPASLPSSVMVSGRPVELLGSSSPLEIRARVSEDRTAPLVVLTGCDTDALGADLLARALDRRLHAVDRWVTVCELFGAERPSRPLAQRSELADALLESKPVNGYPRLATKVLDLDTALDALVRWHLELDALSLPQVLAWAERPQAARALQGGGPITSELIDQLIDHLAGQLGEGARFALTAARAGKGEELMALALAATVVYAVEPGGELSPEQHRATVRLDAELGSHDLRSDACRQIGQAAVERVQTGGVDQVVVGRWITRADQLVEQWKLNADAWQSPVLVSGFTQRLARAAAAIEAWRSVPGPAVEAEAMAAIGLVASHRQGMVEPHRVERVEMAARLVRRQAMTVMATGTLTDVVTGYTQQGAWLDRARVLVSRRDTEPTLAELCARLADEADAVRTEQGAELATVLAAAAHHMPPGLVGVESVLDTVVAPLAATVPVLLVVFDGMGWPTFTEVLERLEEQGWTSVADQAGIVRRPALAALPTVTEVSRTSLLAGVLRAGDNESEKRAFTAHKALVAVGAKNRPPRLFHKADFRDGGIDTTTEAAIAAVRDERIQVVGMVLNNIDERLKDVAAPPNGWGLLELNPLADMLDAARAAGRAVVVTADHGHVLERGSEQRPAGGGGERWRSEGSGPAGDGEIEVSGPRVVVGKDPGGTAVLAWAEQLRYGPRRNGYHGGLTPAELIVPLAVLATDTIAGWEPLAITPPSWWHANLATDHPTNDAAPIGSIASGPAASGADRVRRAGSEPGALTLFDAAPLVAEPTPGPAKSAGSKRSEAGQDPIGRILAVDQIRAALPGLRLDPSQVAEFLRALDQAGGTAISELRVADAIGLNRSRIGRFTAQIQRLLNIDGYAVVESVGGELRFNRALLETQLGLG